MGFATSTPCVDHEPGAGVYSGAGCFGLVFTRRTPVILRSFSDANGSAGKPSTPAADSPPILRNDLRFMNAAPSAETAILFSPSERQLQSKLYIPRRIGLTGDHSEVSPVDCSSGSREHRGIGEIECLGAELKLESLGQPEILE